MKVTLSTTLDTPIDVACEQVRTSRLLLYVAAPLVRFRAIEPPRLPERWEPGTYEVAMRLFGVVPLGRQAVVISVLGSSDEPGRRWLAIRDAGHGQMVRVWDHVITLREAGQGRTVYTDEVRIGAGVLTLGVYLFAQIFYRWRQRRWVRLVRNGFQYGATGESDG